MGKKTIAIVAGGDSSEKHISINGAEFVLSQLSKDKYDAKIVIVSSGDWFVRDSGGEFKIDKNDFSYISFGQRCCFDFVIILIHGTPGENGLLQSYFELISLPYSTGGVPSSVASFDKEFCKSIVKNRGINVANGTSVKRCDNIDTEAILSKYSLPLFVKPNASGSSFGVTKVKKNEELLPAINAAFKESDIVLIEETLSGREVSCGIFSSKGKMYVLPITEIVTSQEFFDYKAKYEGLSQEITPADFPKSIVEKINNDTVLIYKELRCRGVVRVDFIVDKDIPYMIEINNIPGMSLKSIIPQQLSSYGMTISEMYELIINDILDNE